MYGQLAAKAFSIRNPFLMESYPELLFKMRYATFDSMDLCLLEPFLP